MNLNSTGKKSVRFISIDRSLDSINKKSGNLENGSDFYKVDNKQQALRFTDTESNEGYEEYLEVANLVSEIRKTVCRLDSENASSESVIRESEMFAFLIAIKEVSPRMFTDMEATVWNSVDCENEENWIEKTRELYKIYYGWNESIFKWVKNIGTLEYEINKRFEKFS